MSLNVCGLRLLQEWMVACGSIWHGFRQTEHWEKHLSLPQSHWPLPILHSKSYFFTPTSSSSGQKLSASCLMVLSQIKKVKVTDQNYKQTLSQSLASEATVVVNLDCQPHGIYNHHGSKPLGMNVGDFADWVNWGTKTHPKLERHHSICCCPRLHKKEKIGWQDGSMVLKCLLPSLITKFCSWDPPDRSGVDSHKLVWWLCLAFNLTVSRIN